MQNLIIDTDAGVDDAIAIMMALAHPDINTLAITTVNGNVDVDKVTKNVGIVTGLLNSSVPIFRGCERPILANRYHSDGVHGVDGLGGVSESYDEVAKGVEDERAALALVRLARQYSDNFILLALGPLTNIALAVRLDPMFVHNTRELVIMGGAVEARGNASPAAEYNILADPEAASIVFDAGFKKIWVLPWETTLKYPINWAIYDELVSVQNDRTKFFYNITAQLVKLFKNDFKWDGLLIPDPLAAAVAIETAVVQKAEQVSIMIEIDGRVGRGLTAVDWLLRYSNIPNSYVVTEINATKTIDLIRMALS